jgi:hypothetical protein
VAQGLGAQRTTRPRHQTPTHLSTRQPSAIDSDPRQTVSTQCASMRHPSRRPLLLSWPTVGMSFAIRVPNSSAYIRRPCIHHHALRETCETTRIDMNLSCFSSVTPAKIQPSSQCLLIHCCGNAKCIQYVRIAHRDRHIFCAPSS